MNAIGLESALAAIGIRCNIEIEGRLVILRIPPTDTQDWAAAADDVVALARQHGFTHAAVEPTPTDAPIVPGD